MPLDLDHRIEKQAWVRPEPDETATLRWSEVARLLTVTTHHDAGHRYGRRGPVGTPWGVLETAGWLGTRGAPRPEPRPGDVARRVGCGRDGGGRQGAPSLGRVRALRRLSDAVVQIVRCRSPLCSGCREALTAAKQLCGERPGEVELDVVSLASARGRKRAGEAGVVVVPTVVVDGARRVGAPTVEELWLRIDGAFGATTGGAR